MLKSIRLFFKLRSVLAHAKTLSNSLSGNGKPGWETNKFWEQEIPELTALAISSYLGYDVTPAEEAEIVRIAEDTVKDAIQKFQAVHAQSQQPTTK